MPDVKYRVDAGRSKQSVEQTLQAFLDVTESQYGFIGTVHHDDDDLLWLQTQAISNIAWDQASRELYESALPEGLQFRNLKTFFGQTLRTGKLFVSNSPNEDASRGGLPSGHPALTALMGIPLKVDDRLIGMVGIANRSNGYDLALADWLEPLSTTAATLIIASRSQEARQAAENEAAHRQKQLQTILDSVNARILYLDTEGRIVRHNLHSQEMTGLPADNCIGKTVEEVGLRLDSARLRHQQSLKVMRSGKPKLGRLISHTSEGKTYWSTVDKIPTFDANGKVDGLLVFLYDVTELHSTTETLQQTESQLSILLQKMPALLWSVDQNHVFTLAVGKTLERLGKQPGETVGSTLSEYFGTDDPLSPPIARHLSALNGESVQYESTWNGCSFECRPEPVRNGKGEVTGCLGVALDVTDRAQSELERRQTEEQWWAVVENVPDFILVVGREGQIRFLNLFQDGHDRRDVLQATVFDYQPVESHDKIRAALRRVFEDGESVSYETIGRGKPDEWRNYVCRVVPMDVSETEPAALMIATDVTEERVARDAEERHFALLNAITEGTSELIFAKDTESQPVFVNEATIRLHGKTSQEMIGSSEEALFSKSSFDKTVADDKRIMRTGQSEVFEEVLELVNGKRTFLTTNRTLQKSFPLEMGC